MQCIITKKPLDICFLMSMFQVAVGFCLSYDMLSTEENKKQDLALSSDSGILPALNIHKDLQVQFSNHTLQV